MRAELLAELVTGLRMPENSIARAVRVSGARIAGRLDLAYSTLHCPLLLQDCYFSEPVRLRGATAQEVGLLGCHVPGLDANLLRTQGGLQLGFGFSASGTVELAAAHIGGQLLLDGASITNPDGQALLATELSVEKSMLCRHGFSAEGEVQLHQAHIGGWLDFNEADLRNPNAMALAADGLTVGGTMRASGLAANGAVWLRGGHIGGNLEFSGAKLTNPQGHALAADQLTVEGNLIGQGLTAEGEVHLSAAQIGGCLVLENASLTNAEGELALQASLITVEQDVVCGGVTTQGELHLSGARVGGFVRLSGARLVGRRKALVMDGAEVRQAMDLRDGFAAQGEVRMVGLELRGTLDLRGASFSNCDGIALVADGLSVGDAVFADGVAAQGEVRLPYAQIDRVLSFEDAELMNPDGYALVLAGLAAKQEVRCDGLTAVGEVRLADAAIGGQLVLDRARLTNPDGWSLQAQSLNVKLDVLCRDGFTAEGEVYLAAAQIGGVLDFTGAKLIGHEKEALNLFAARVGTLQLLPTEPLAGRVVLTDVRVKRFIDDPTTWPSEFDLSGFVYERLDEDVRVRTRLRWLARHAGGYVPQIYEQLGTTYRQAGDEESARQVAIAKQRQRRSRLNLLGKTWDWLLYLTVGYGYRTWLAAVWLAALTVVGSWAFDRAYPDHMVAASASSPNFHSVGYTLDVLLPIADLGQQGEWVPQGAVNYLSWLLIAAGWMLTTAVVAGVTGVLNRS